MTHHVQCPHCARAVVCGPEHVGKSGQCPHCGQTFTIAAPAGLMPSMPRRPRIWQPRWWSTLGVGLLALAIGTVLELAFGIGSIVLAACVLGGLYAIARTLASILTLLIELRDRR